MMDRAKAIEWLEQLRDEEELNAKLFEMDEHPSDMDNPHTPWVEMYEIALDALREQSVTDCNQWISTSDRLPERSGDYLVRTCPNGNNAVMHFSVRHQAFNSFDDLDRAQHKIPCLHWMPLPGFSEGGTE